MLQIPLPAQWTARAVSNLDEIPPEIHNREIPAQVPGCIHLDLMREELIPDPYLAENECAFSGLGAPIGSSSPRFRSSTKRCNTNASI
jgi:beta-mannosidase